MMPAGRQDTDSLTQPRRWPLVANLDSRQPIGLVTPQQVILAYNKDARIINGYIERDANDGEYWVYKRPGFSSSLLGPGGGAAGNGLLIPYNNVTSYTLQVFGTTVYQNGVTLGTVTGNTSNVSWQVINYDSSNHGNVLLNSPGHASYYISTNAATLNKITDVNFPTFTAGGWAYLDGFIYIMDTTGRIFESVNQNDPTTWSPLDTITASSNADGGVYLTKQLSYIIAFKQWTTQIFYDAGNPTGSSLAPVPDAQIPVGCLDGTSVQSIDDTLLWISSSQSLSPKVMQMDNLSPQVVSTPMVEKLLTFWRSTGAGFFPNVYSAGCYSFVLKLGGHRFYGLTNVALNLTVVYDLDQKRWTQWTDANGNYFPYINTTYQIFGIQTKIAVYMQHISTGYYQEISLADYFPTDGGAVVPVDIYTPNYDGGSIRSKTLNAMYFETDIVRGSKLLTRFSDDDYDSWTQYRETDLGLPKPFIDQEGSFDYRRAYNLRHMGPQPFRIKAGYMQLDYGTL